MNKSHRIVFLTLACFLVAGTFVLAQRAQPAPKQPASPKQPAVARQPAAAPAPAVGANDPLDAPEVKAAFDKAAKLFTAASFNDAHAVLKTAYEKFPAMMPPRVAMAQFFARSNVQQGVLPSLELATRETPNDPEAYLLLAEIALQRGSLTSAELLLGKADTLNNAYRANPLRQKNMVIQSLRHRTALCEARDDWPGVAAHINRLIEIQGESPILVRQLAVSLFQQKNDAKARELLLKAQGMAVDENRGLPADAVLAQLYQRRGDMVNARKSLDNAVKANPESLEVHTMLVMMKLADNLPDEARVAVEKLLEVDWQAAQKEKRFDATGKPEISANTKRLIATVALFRGEYAIAEQYFQEVIQSTPGDAVSANGLALALCEQTTTDAEGKTVPDTAKLRRALEYAVGNVQKQQNNREFLATLGWVYIKAGDARRAIEVLKRACADGQITPDAAYYLAKLSVDDGNAEQARGLLKPALANNRPFLKRNSAQALLDSLPAPVAAESTATPVR